MFSNPRNKLDLKTTLDGGKIILVNTAKDVLKDEASSFFGRYIIALVMQAAFERAAQPEHQRWPAFLYIDEASEYFDPIAYAQWLEYSDKPPLSTWNGPTSPLEFNERQQCRRRYWVSLKSSPLNKGRTLLRTMPYRIHDR